MPLLIRLIGMLIFTVGAVFSYGAYVAVEQKQVPTFTLVLLPVAQLFAGLGLIQLRPLGRFLALSLCSFLVLLGVLAHRGIVATIDYLPLVQLIEHVPLAFFEWNLSHVSITCYFIMPMFIAIILCTSWPTPKQATVSWQVPLLVALVSTFVVSHSLLMKANMEPLISEEVRVIFGTSLSQTPSGILFCFEFLIPIVVGFGLAHRERWAWAIALVIGVAYWLPVLDRGVASDDFKSFEFLFFGIGWLLTIVCVLVYWKLFWRKESGQQEIVNLPRVNVMPLAKTSSTLAGQPSEKKKTKVVGVFFVIALGLIVFVGVLFVILSNVKLGEFKPGPQGNGEELGAEAEVDGPEVATFPLRLEGTSIDGQSSHAIINGEILVVGDVVLDYRIVAIKPNRVLISRDSERKWLDAEGNLAPAA
jgi:hypothetical protein